MNNREVSERLHDCGVMIGKIIWIAGQSHEQDSDDWEDFLYDTEHAQKTLGVALHDDYLDFDDYEELVGELLRLKKDGFLVKLRKPVPRNIKLGDDGKPVRWNEGGSWRTEWIYVDDLSECVVKAESFATSVLDDAVRQQKARLAP